MCYELTNGKTKNIFIKIHNYENKWTIPYFYLPANDIAEAVINLLHKCENKSKHIIRIIM